MRRIARLFAGVRTYVNYPELTLDGPRNDAEKLAALLEKDWKFSPADVSVLIDDQGTRANILNELDRLIKAAQRGDHVLFYYSGHGTSFHDLATHGFGIDVRTGAIVPSDLRKVSAGRAGRADYRRSGFAAAIHTTGAERRSGDGAV